MKIVIQVNKEGTGYGIDMIEPGKHPKSVTHLTDSKINRIALALALASEVQQLLLKDYV